jgi:hypothetical protein
VPARAATAWSTTSTRTRPGAAAAVAVLATRTGSAPVDEEVPPDPAATSSVTDPAAGQTGAGLDAASWTAGRAANADATTVDTATAATGFDTGGRYDVGGSPKAGERASIEAAMTTVSTAATPGQRRITPR